MNARAQVRPTRSIAWPRIALLLAVLAAPAGAQPSPYRMQQLAPGVHVAVRDVPAGGVSDANVLVIVNQADVVVVDANIFPASAREMIAEIRKLTPNPVRYVVNTHWHSDHHYGNQAYREAWPGVEFVTHPATRELILARDVPALARNLATEYPAEIARMRRTLETGRRENGDTLTAAAREQLGRTMGVYEFFLRDMRGVQPVPATLTVADSLVLHRGERTIVIAHLGKGNTPGDMNVYLPRERIVATGDLVVSPTPFAFFSTLSAWPATLRRLARLDATTMVPGHGDVMHDWAYVNKLAALIDTTWRQVQTSVAAGADLEATRKAVNVDGFRATFGSGTPERRKRAFDGLYLNPAVESAFNELKPDSAAAAKR
jgi:glyoxylase-like metal-dependent hydrolase (beta-lactamase superfamily II)